jgi:transglutaminase-like putative cysteine protease
MIPDTEDSVRLRVAVLVTVMAAATAVVRVGATSPLLTVACLAGVPAAYWYSYRARHRDDLWLKLVVALGLVAAFAHFLIAVAGLGTEGLGSVQVPLAELFLWVQVLHSVHLPLRRDLMFSIASSVALIALAGVLSTSLDVAPHLVVWLVAFVTSLVLAHRRELDELPSLGMALGDGRAVLRPIAGVMVALIVVATGVFLVTPGASANRRLGFPARLPGAVPIPGGGGGLANPSLGDSDPGRGDSAPTGKGRSSYGYFGFSDRLDLGVRGRPDHTLVMKVRATRPDFWRGQTFDQWDGRQWTLSDDASHPVRGDRPLSIPSTTPVFGPAEELLQTFYLQRPGPNLIFAAAQPSELWFPDNTVFLLSDGTLRAAVELGDGAVYTVVSRRPPVTADLLRSVDGAQADPRLAQSDQFMQRYTQLPDVPQRVRRLARSITARAPTTYDKVRAIETWLGEHTEYSLDVPPLPAGADAVEQFLFVDRVGFCEQIGSSLVVMLRSLGIPARLAAGYAPGERNPFTGMFEVRAGDAHAWAEVWFPGVGWQGFDPTASVPLAGEAGSTAAGAQLFSYLGKHLPHPPLVPTVVVALVVGAGLVLVPRARRRRADRRLPWGRRYLVQLEAEGARRGRPRQPHETGAAYVSELARSVLPDPRLAAVAAILASEAYAPDPPSDDERDRAELVLAEAAARWPA